MFSFSVGKVHYHTLKSDIISLLIFLFIWHTILFIQQNFKTCLIFADLSSSFFDLTFFFKQENENTTLCKMKTTGFQIHQEKNAVDYIYFHHFHVL